jgi:hypothetical protein
MAYATISDVRDRLSREMSSEEVQLCVTLLDDAAVLIDSVAPAASADAKKVVSCRMVIRAVGSGGQSGIPIGATQGSMAALGYTQSWTIGSGSTGELYLSKTERQLLGCGNRIGSYSPTEELVPEVST